MSGTARVVGEFFQRMSREGLSVLMLDYDGTLAPFRDDPAQAVPYPGVREVLREIRACPNTRLVFISGRQAHEVQRLVDLGGVEIWGCHGLEKLGADGTRCEPQLDGTTKDSLGKLRELLHERSLLPFTETKPTGYAVHWRGLSATEAEEIKARAGKLSDELPPASGLRRLNFDGGIEICADAMNKGDVVERIAAEFPAGCSMAYLGDDVTDEDAFRAMRGKGLGVLVRELYRETAATAWLRPPGELLTFLRSWIEACKETQ